MKLKVPDWIINNTLYILCILELLKFQLVFQFLGLVNHLTLLFTVELLHYGFSSLCVCSVPAASTAGMRLWQWI
jgi:hypothetical protein